jgi:hypothetical protein
LLGGHAEPPLLNRRRVRAASPESEPKAIAHDSSPSYAIQAAVAELAEAIPHANHHYKLDDKL